MKKKESKPKKAKAAKKQPEYRLEKIPVRYQFTEQDMSQLGSKLAGLAQEKTRVEEEKKVAMSQWTTRIKGIQNDISAVSGKISSGFEMRDTECQVEYDWKKGEKHYYLDGFGNKVETRRIEEHERQQHLFEEEQAKNGDKPAPLKAGEPIVSVDDAIRKAEQTNEVSADE